MARRRLSVELNEQQWTGLAQSAARVGCQSWRTMLRLIGEGEIQVARTKPPVAPVSENTGLHTHQLPASGELVYERDADAVTHQRGQTDTSADKHWVDDPQ